MTTFLSSNRALKLLYSGNALWFTSALIHFGFRQKLMMQKLSHRKRSTDAAIRSTPSGDAWHHDIMAYLGGMNTSLAVLAGLRLYALFRPSSALVSTGSAKGDVPLDFLALVVLGAGNFSQAFANFTIGARTDRWIMGKGFDRITVLDAVFTVLDWTAAFGRVSML